MLQKGNTALDDLKEQYRDSEDGQLAKMIALFVHALGDKSDRVNLEDESARQNRLDLENGNECISVCFSRVFVLEVQLV